MGQFILNEKEVEVKISEYLPIAKKKDLISIIVDKSLTFSGDGFAHIDYFGKKVARDIALFTYYTDYVEEIDYDNMVASGILDEIYNVAHKDIDDIDDIVEYELKDIVKVNNSLEHTIHKMFEELIEKIPTSKQLSQVIKKGVSALNGVDKETLKILMQGQQQENLSSKIKEDLAKNNKNTKIN